LFETVVGDYLGEAKSASVITDATENGQAVIVSADGRGASGITQIVLKHGQLAPCVLLNT
jgi:hypothetical protein